MKAYINLLHYPVKVLGPGDRVGLWFQGCTIRCKGCMSVHTWEFDEKYLIEIDKLVKRINSLPTDKLTISGGEPFDQPEALREILKGVRETKKDILVYTGYTYSKVSSLWKNILELIDVLITEPFVEGKDTELVWKGSSNQKMIILNEELKPIYSDYVKAKKDKKLQIVHGEGQAYLIGIPYQTNWKEVAGLIR